MKVLLSIFSVFDLPITILHTLHTSSRNLFTMSPFLPIMLPTSYNWKFIGNLSSIRSYVHQEWNICSHKNICDSVNVCQRLFFFFPRASNAMASKGLYEIYPRETMATGRDSESWSLIFFRVEPSRGLGMGWTKAKGWRWDHQVNFTFPCIMILMERVGRSEVDFTRVAIAWVLESVNRRVRQERLGVSNWSRSAWLMERKRKPKYWKVSCKYLMWLQSAVSALKKLKVNSNFLIYYKWVSTFQHNSVWF